MPSPFHHAALATPRTISYTPCRAALKARYTTVPETMPVNSVSKVVISMAMRATKSDMLVRECNTSMHESLALKSFRVTYALIMLQ